MSNIEKFNQYGWSFIIMILGLSLILLFTFFIFVDKPVKQYYLGADSIGAIKIKVDINWAEDKTIRVPRHITLEEAVTIIDSLNKGLSKYPRLK